MSAKRVRALCGNLACSSLSIENPALSPFSLCPVFILHLSSHLHSWFPAHSHGRLGNREPFSLVGISRRWLPHHPTNDLSPPLSILSPLFPHSCSAPASLLMLAARGRLKRRMCSSPLFSSSTHFSLTSEAKFILTILIKERGNAVGLGSSVVHAARQQHKT